MTKRQLKIAKTRARKPNIETFCPNRNRKKIRLPEHACIRTIKTFNINTNNQTYFIKLNIQRQPIWKSSNGVRVYCSCSLAKMLSNRSLKLSVLFFVGVFFLLTIFHFYALFYFSNVRSLSPGNSAWLGKVNFLVNENFQNYLFYVSCLLFNFRSQSKPL